MTHSPPVPPGNTSPYPVQEPPHSGTSAPAPVKSAKSIPADLASGWSLGKIFGAAAGVGAIAIGVAAILFPRDGKAKPTKPGAKAKPKKQAD
jgi:hypothetical protein